MQARSIKLTFWLPLMTGCTFIFVMGLFVWNNYQNALARKFHQNIQTGAH
jgi:hypothetical protein